MKTLALIKLVTLTILMDLFSRRGKSNLLGDKREADGGHTVASHSSPPNFSKC